MTTPPTPTRQAAYRVGDRVTTLLDGYKYTGRIDAVKPPDATRPTHCYHVVTSSGSELWLDEPRLQRGTP